MPDCSLDLRPFMCPERLSRIMELIMAESVKRSFPSYGKVSPQSSVKEINLAYLSFWPLSPLQV